MKGIIERCPNIIDNPWDDIEIHGCVEVQEGFVEQVEDEDAQFFTCYVHYPEMGVDWISDHPTRKDAEEFREWILGLSKMYQP